MTVPNTHVNIDANEDEVEAHDTALDQEYMSKVGDEIAKQLMQLVK